MMRCLAALVSIVAAVAAAAGDEVKVTQSGGKIVLRNAYLEVAVTPGKGMYVPYARDLTTGEDITTVLKLNFPFYEHGIKADQPAGWRILRDPDGGATVAMNMRFAHHRGGREVHRYGRFGERGLSEFVTLRPNEARFEFRGRADNPTPFRRSNRLWDRAFMPARKDTHFIMPASHGIEHAALWIKPWPRRVVTDPATGKDKTVDFEVLGNWVAYGRQPTQYFGLWARYGFAGLWYPEEGINRVRINDPKTDPGMKFYCARGAGTMELWGGTTVVFENNGHLVDGYTPTELTKCFYLVKGIGKLSFATKDVALHVTPGDEPVVQATGPVPLGDIRVDVLAAGGGQVVASARGAIGPGKVIEVRVPRPMTKLTVTVHQPAPAGGGPDAGVPAAGCLLSQTFPLDLQDTADRYEEARAGCSPAGGLAFYERQEHACHNRPGALAAGRAGQQALQAGLKDVKDLESLANACYRIGDFDQAEALAKAAAGLDPQSEHAHHVLGMIACEKGDTPAAAAELAKAGIQANYVRALMAHQAGKDDQAVDLLKAMVTARPKVFRPRMLLAYLQARAGRKAEGVALARSLVAENPASPEACETLARAARLAGQADLAAEAAKAVKALVTDNPDAPRQLGLFRNELDKGTWVYVARYRTALPQP